jgi:hypothetical protein
VGVGVGEWPGVAVGVDVWASLGVAVGVGVSTSVGVGVGVGVCVGASGGLSCGEVAVGSGMGVGDGVWSKVEPTGEQPGGVVIGSSAMYATMRIASSPVKWPSQSVSPLSMHAGALPRFAAPCRVSAASDIVIWLSQSTSPRTRVPGAPWAAVTRNSATARAIVAAIKTIGRVISTSRDDNAHGCR